MEWEWRGWVPCGMLWNGVEWFGVRCSTAVVVAADVVVRRSRRGGGGCIAGCAGGCRKQ